MRRFARLPALLALLVALLVLLAPGLVCAEEKTFADKNFKLQASDSWEWSELGSQQIQDGYVASLYRRAGGTLATVIIRVVPTNDLPLGDMTLELKAGLSASLTAVQGSKVTKGKLSGLECDLVLIKGLDKQDSPVLLKIYNLQIGGVFHQMIFRLTDGADAKQAKEVDALRRGYRLLKGAGPEEEAPETPPGAEDVEESDESAPSREGRTITFPTHNVKWTLPEDSIFEWKSIASNEGVKQGMLCRAEARIEHEPPKGSKDKEPTIQSAVVILGVEPQREGWTPKGVAHTSQNHTGTEKNYFDKVDYGRMKIIDELPVGNHTGAAYQMVGTKDGQARFYRLYAVGLKGEAYIIQVILTGDRRVNDDFKAPLKKFLAGLEFIDTFVWARGPLAIPGIRDHDQDRGKYVDVEKEFTYMGFKAKKPKGMAHLPFKPGETGGGLRLAWEKRSEDKTAYLYFDVQSWPQRATRKTKDFDQERIKEREGKWIEHAGSPNTVKKGKTAWFKASYGRAKGLGYEFTGYLNETPYTEIGYVVAYKKYVYWIRYQLAGENADKIFAKDLKKLKKAIKFGT